MTAKYDALLIPNGGLRKGVHGELVIPPYVLSRLERAVDIEDQVATIYLLGKGTPFKLQPTDQRGLQVNDSKAYADYLATRLKNPSKLRTEGESICTISNAYFARLHTDQMPVEGKPAKLIVVNSGFHIDRTKVVFDWVFGLDGLSSYQPLDYVTTPNEGITKAGLESRQEKEAAGLARFQDQVRSGDLSSITSIDELTEWLFTKHNWFKPGGRASDELPSAVSETY